jgi:deoxycytidylate deaminase
MEGIMKYIDAIHETLRRLGREVDEESVDQLEEALGIRGDARDESYQRWSLDSAFMSMAYIASKCSHDSNTQHGAVIVDRKNHIVSTGFNGFLSGSFDDKLPNNRVGGYKYPHMLHAENNALDQSTRADLSDCRIYVTGVPCNVCFRKIISRGIREVIIGDVGHVYEPGFWETHYFLSVTHKVQVRHFEGIIVDTSKTLTIGPDNGSTEEGNRNGPHGLQQGESQ